MVSDMTDMAEFAVEWIEAIDIVCWRGFKTEFGCFDLSLLRSRRVSLWDYAVDA